MVIRIKKQQPGSWHGLGIAEKNCGARLSASEWHALCVCANARQCSKQRIVREALREYFTRHGTMDGGDELLITVRGNDGTKVLQKIKNFFEG